MLTCFIDLMSSIQIDPLTGNVAQVQHIDRERLESNPIMLRLRAHQVRLKNNTITLLLSCRALSLTRLGWRGT